MKLIVLLFLLGVAHAARQIPIINNPPPPGPTSGNAPGVVFSVVVPNKSAAAWTSADSTYFCQGMVNLTSGYPREYVECTVKAVTSSQNYVAAAVGGQMYWSQYAGQPASAPATAVTSRDLFISQIARNKSLPSNIYAGANINDTCNSGYELAANTASPELATAGMPLSTCRLAPLGLPVESTATSGQCGSFKVTNQELCFTSKTVSTLGMIGIDNGKVCPTGSAYITRGTQKKVEVVTAGTTTISIGAASGGVQTVKFETPLSIPANSVQVRSVVSLAGFKTSDMKIPASSGAGCTVSALVAALNTAHTLTAVSVATSPSSASFEIADLGCAAGTIAEFTAANKDITASGEWSPLCDENNDFYQNNNPSSGKCKGGYETFGCVCPACSTTSSTSNTILFAYNGPNAGKFCSSLTIEGGAIVAQLNQTGFDGAGMRGTSCIDINVNDQTASNAATGTPMLRTVVPYSTEDVFPTPSNANPGTFSASSVVPFNNENSKFVALDSEWSVPCSTPKLSRSGAIVGVIGSGSCNTQSRWFNGGTGITGNGNGIPPYGSNYANLETSFFAPIVAPGPAPSPAKPPVIPPEPSTPSPAKPPSPSVSPSPTPLVCTYSGNYQLKPLYAPCNNYFIASGTSSDCSNNYVNLRSKSQLGGKIARSVWKFATIAQNNLSTPTNVLATARTSCTNKYLAAPSDPSQGLKVGGSSWRWQFVPYPGSSKCDEVNMISQNRIGTTAFLEVPKTCDRFRYNATDGGRQRFKVVKV